MSKTIQELYWDDENPGVPATHHFVFGYEGRWYETDMSKERFRAATEHFAMLVKTSRPTTKRRSLLIQSRPKTVKPQTTRTGRHNRSGWKPQSQVTITTKTGGAKITGGQGGMGKPKAAAKPKAQRGPRLTKEERRTIATFADQVMGIQLKPVGRIPKDVLSRFYASQRPNGTAPIPSTPATTGVK